MRPLEKLTLVTLGILLSGVLAAKVLQISNLSNPSHHALLFGWLWFNLFIAIYELYIVYNRQKFHPSKCPPHYWREHIGSHSQSHSHSQDFWLNTWHEYTCQSDLRYLTPSSYVFSIEFTNAILVILLWIAYLVLGPSSKTVSALLLLQLVVCALYFATLTRKNLNTTTPTPIKTVIYLFISALWIIIPLILLLFVSP